MQKDPDFNHHAKCEKMGITHLTFADDVLMFCRGDVTSVDMMMKVLHTFADTTGLIVNPKKCKVFFGEVDLETRNKIKELNTYEEGLLPFRYLGVPLTIRKLNIKHYLPLIDTILAKVKHWSSRLLSMTTSVGALSGLEKRQLARRVQLPGNLFVSQRVLECLWNLCLKADNLWVKWVHIHYLKKKPLMEAVISDSSLWVIKKIFNLREHIPNLQPAWDHMIQKRNFSMKCLYDKMVDSDKVDETLNHLLFDCRFAKAVWKHIL
ncbi:uncharacterized protein LOC131650011 [Vicia villosa]|uniref:uncharacterized protein LOC131650011 n=1 Tax=Vicia villosa TaxID=3911 RepID=UPI00273C44DF|nr:uncharacterized protein LOC131650011 [Vicia villosa]